MKCPVCGKQFDVLWPHQWVFKRDNRPLCSWGCMRALDDKKGINQDMALTKEQKQTVIDMLLKGESPNRFIESCGVKNPTCTVWNLKNYLKRNEPEIYAKLNPAPAKKPEKIADAETPETPKVKLDGTLKIETPEACNVKVAVIGKPETAGPMKRENRYTVTAIQYPEIGEFYYDRKYNTIDWRTPEGDEVSMSPTGWKLLLQDLNEIMTVLGVKA